MFRFANIEFLWLLFSIPVLAATYFIYTRYKRRQLEEFGDPELMSQLMPNASRVRPNVKFAILLTALTLLIIAAARPQFGVEETEEDQHGFEAVIALDISFMRSVPASIELIRLIRTKAKTNATIPAKGARYSNVFTIPFLQNNYYLFLQSCEQIYKPSFISTTCTVTA